MLSCILHFILYLTVESFGCYHMNCRTFSIHIQQGVQTIYSFHLLNSCSVFHFVFLLYILSNVLLHSEISVGRCFYVIPVQSEIFFFIIVEQSTLKWKKKPKTKRREKNESINHTKDTWSDQTMIQLIIERKK